MCGRYEIDVDAEEIQEIISKLNEKYPKQDYDIGEIFPTNTVPILLKKGGEIGPELARWGFPHFKGNGVIINARSETVEEKSSFRENFFERRCVILATAFFEWTKNRKPKRKYSFKLPDESVIYMAGFYKELGEEKKFVILTSEANSTIKEIHDRMPVILRKENIGDWIEDLTKATEMLFESSPDFKKQIC